MCPLLWHSPILRISLMEAHGESAKVLKCQWKWGFQGFAPGKYGVYIIDLGASAWFFEALGELFHKEVQHEHLGINSTSILYIICMLHPRIENAVWILQQIHCHHHCAFNCHYQIVQTGAYNGDDVPQQLSECSCSPNCCLTHLGEFIQELIMTHVMLIHVMLHLKPFESPVFPNVLYELIGISPNKWNRLQASTGAGALGRGKCLMELWSLVPQNPKISAIL